MARDEPVADDPSSLTRTGSALAALPLPFAAVVTVLTFWSVDSSAPALTDLRDDLMLNSTVAGLVFSFFFLGRLLGNVPATRYADRIGAALLAAAGGGSLMLGATVVAIARNAPVVLAGRTLEGVGIAMLVTASLFSILRARPGGGAAMSYFTAVSTVGAILGLTTGGWLTESWSWRAVFILHMLLGSLTVTVALIAHTRSRTVATETPDLVGGPIAAFDRRVVSTGLVANALVFANYSIFAVSVPLYADERFGAGPEEISFLLLSMTASHIVFAYPAGWLVRIWGGIRVLTLGNLTAAAGIGLILAAPRIWWLFAPLILYAFGQVLASNAAGDYILQRGGRSGKAVGWMRLSGDLGLVIGPLVVGLIADFFGFRAPFVFLPVVTLVVITLTLARLRPSPGLRPPSPNAGRGYD